MSDQGFGGRYPGGPRRSADGTIGETRKPGPPDIASVGEMEDRALAAAGRSKRERRARRIRVGLLLAVLVGSAVGVWLGLGSHATPEEMVEEIDRAAEPSPLSSEEMLRRELIRLQSQPQPSATQPGARQPGAPSGTRP